MTVVSRSTCGADAEQQLQACGSLSSAAAPYLPKHQTQLCVPCLPQTCADATLQGSHITAMGHHEHLLLLATTAGALQVHDLYSGSQDMVLRCCSSPLRALALLEPGACGEEEEEEAAHVAVGADSGEVRASQAAYDSGAWGMR